MPTQLDNAKEALAQIGTRSKITSLTDGSAEAAYVNLLYVPLRNFLLAEGDYDFSIEWANTSAAAGSAPFPWIYGYVYPTDALRIRQLIPLDFVAEDPHPIAWNVSGSAGFRLIFTTEQVSRIIYTKAVDELLWDPLFQQSFVRLLSSALAFALENRIEASKQKLEESLSFAGIANLRDA